MLNGVILDVDGTVVRGDEALPGARAGLDLIADSGLRRLFVSNNPTKPAVAYEARFARAGFDVSSEEIVTAATVTSSYLDQHYPEEAHFVVGEAGLRTLLSEAGLSLTADPAEATVLVASIDRAFDYDTLCTAMRVLAEESVAFVGTDPDMVIPTAAGDIPGSGAVIHAIAGVVGRDPDIVLGKPSEPARDLVVSTLGLDPRECLVVGDRLDTDIAFGVAAGMTTALVRTGVTDDADLAASDIEPDYVLDSLADLYEVDGLG
ncbi:HAD family hydrolase [Salinigranum rubrum]|uniref:HAD family hydrolase n=1 Tax=Salinigranum rubrum TaxID=755307 RepID=A0A2I8VKM1_9EURY|nr:HAD-IIA family hydrolase [Salinigranum rubrum]AUV81629.1 HAD family hydrolase [Salinigranum rubrum]